jgi:hypothetical protein
VGSGLGIVFFTVDIFRVGEGGGNGTGRREVGLFSVLGTGFYPLLLFCSISGTRAAV